MTIKYIYNDIFSSPSQTLVNPVNCVGVMGAGLASAFKKRYPLMFQEYQQKCSRKEIRPGESFLYQHSQQDKWILLFPTKNHWKDKSDLNQIEAGLRHFGDNYLQWRITSIAFPPLGCGLGGLHWEDVKPLMEDCLKNIKIPVEIYSPMEIGN